jgi:hypothetical protein
VPSDGSELSNWTATPRNYQAFSSDYTVYDLATFVTQISNGYIRHGLSVSPVILRW